MYLSGHRFGRRLSRLDKTGGKAPAAVVGSPKEEDAALRVADDRRYSGQEQEPLADDRPQIPQVVGDRHRIALSDEGATLGA